MEKDMVELILKRLNELEKKLERYYKILKIDNELDFILNGTYCFEKDIENLLQGKNKG